MKKILLLGLLGLAIPAVAEVGTGASTPRKELRVLMIGNSFSICVGKEMPNIAKAMGLKLELASLYIGGCSLKQHWANWIAGTNANYRPYIFDHYVDGVVKKRGDMVSIPGAVGTTSWDIVTFQQASHESWRPETYEPYAGNLQEAIRTRLPEVEFVWQETWSYTPFDARLAQWGLDQNEMYARLHKAYAQQSKGQRIIPMGTAVQLWRRMLPVVLEPGSLGGDVCGRGTRFYRQSDGSYRHEGDVFHLNREGEYLQALVWTAKLFGVDVRKCPYVPDYVTPEKASLMKRVAMEAVRGQDPVYEAIVSAAEGARERNKIAQGSLTDACQLTDYSARLRSVNGTNVWTEAFRAAVREHEIVRIPAGVYFVDGTVVLPSNRRIEADQDAVIRMMPPMDTCFFVNDGARDGSLAPVDKSVANANIAIVGGRWEDWRRKRVQESFSGRWSDGVTKGGGGTGPWFGVSALMYIGNARGVTFRDLTLAHASCFAIQTGDVEDLVCEHLEFEHCHADGVHINGNVKNVLVRDAFGDVGDDLVALNFYDWPCSGVNFGPGENVLVENIRLRSGYPWFRLQPAVHYYPDGSPVDCAARNIIVRNVRGINEFKMFLQTRAYFIKEGILDKSAVTAAENLYFEDIELARAWPPINTAVDDPLRAHRGIFQVGANVRGLRLRNIRAVMPPHHPYLHLVCVGPLSWVINTPKGDLEIYDPWFSCDVKDLTIEDVVYPNGPLAEVVHCTVFDDINRDGFSSGRGRVLAEGGHLPRIAVFGGSCSVIPASKAVKAEWRRCTGLEYDDYGVGGAGFVL